MSIIKCKNCGYLTNTTTCKWTTPDVADICFARYTDGFPDDGTQAQKGCGYDKITNKWYKKWIDGVIKSWNKPAVPVDLSTLIDDKNNT